MGFMGPDPLEYSRAVESSITGDSSSLYQPPATPLNHHAHHYNPRHHGREVRAGCTCGWYAKVWWRCAESAQFDQSVDAYREWREHIYADG